MFFHDALAHLELAVQAPIAARDTGEQLAVFARPVQRQRKLVRVIAPSVAIPHLDQLLDVGWMLPGGAVVLVVTRTARC